MQEVLALEHKDKSKAHSQLLGALQSRYKMLESYIDRAYEDKLAGRLFIKTGGMRTCVRIG
jgi:hypothetical protein